MPPNILSAAGAHPADFPPPAAPAPVDSASISLDARVRDLEANLIMWALKASSGNKSRAAELLQIRRTTLLYRMIRCGLGRGEVEGYRDPDTVGSRYSSRDVEERPWHMPAAALPPNDRADGEEVREWATPSRLALDDEIELRMLKAHEQAADRGGRQSRPEPRAKAAGSNGRNQLIGRIAARGPK
jgi:hypothetical protein